MSLYIFIISCSLIIYVWSGYYILLNILTWIIPDRKLKYDEDFKPFVSIIVPVFDEAEVIAKRIENLLELKYPRDLWEIIIASDGSTDNTIEVVKRYADRGVVALDLKENRGTAEVYNEAIKIARGDILVFTDADTIFEPTFLENIVKPFSNAKVGAVVGKMYYKVSGGEIAENENFYWNHELKIRVLEDKLGILNNGTGAGMAIRKKLYKHLAPVDHVDTATVIDIIFQGFRAVFAAKAVFYDIPPHKAKTEFKVRIRGTSKTLSSMARRTNFIGWLKRPVLVWSLFSHRVGRYLSPFLMILALVTNFFIWEKGIFYQLALIIQLFFYFLVIVGWLGNIIRKKIPVASSCFSFFLAILGMMIGVIKALTGRVTVTFKTDDGL